MAKLKIVSIVEILCHQLLLVLVQLSYVDRMILMKTSKTLVGRLNNVH